MMHWLRTTQSLFSAPRLRASLTLCCGLTALAATGCAVPQPRGNGILSREVEPRFNRGYWRYLPAPYTHATEAGRRARRWPLVVTFHGMKPFDNAYPQAREWEQEADRYGYIVVAPELNAPDVLAEFPLRTEHAAFKADETATLAVLDHLFATTQADPSNVLATSWSSGGYMAHYMVNRHPDRFTCLAVRQSNFSAAVMSAAEAPRSRFHPILIANTENDFAICLRESTEAVRWYEANGFQNVWWIKIRGLGHERTPDMAADFFGRISGVTPSGPPTVLARRQAIDGNAGGLALLSGESAEFHAPAPGAGVNASGRSVAVLPVTPSRAAVEPVRPPAATPAAGPPRATGTTPTPARASRAPVIEPESPLRIHVTSAIGFEPLLFGFNVECPADWRHSADFVWSMDGEVICSGVSGQKTITRPGSYELRVLAVTRDGKEHSATQSVRVLPRLPRDSGN